MYQEHELFIPPPTESVLWRYIDFPRLVALLEKRALFFVRADRLGDPFEGSYSKMNQTLRPGLYLGKIPEEKLGELRVYTSHLRRFTLISCWHERASESEAMWRLYSREQDGIAIKTTFESLKDSLRCTENVYIGRVAYVDYNTKFIREDNLFGPYLCKRESFEHEREVRAVIAKWTQGDEPIVMQKDICDVGMDFDVDLDRLVQEVVVDARADDWVFDLVQAIVAKYKLDAPVTRSALAGEPYW